MGGHFGCVGEIPKCGYFPDRVLRLGNGKALRQREERHIGASYAQFSVLYTDGR